MLVADLFAVIGDFETLDLVKQNVMQPLHMAIVPPICNAIL
jgi:hypothetical protein